jgi:hypothetical protein
MDDNRDQFVGVDVTHLSQVWTTPQWRVIREVTRLPQGWTTTLAILSNMITFENDTTDSVERNITQETFDDLNPKIQYFELYSSL